MNIQQATNILKEENDTLVVFNEKEILRFQERGIRPLLFLYDTKKDYSSYQAVDKVIGKGAAFLYVLLQIKEVKTFVISKSALQVMEKYHIHVEYDTLVPAIFNHTKTGFCPMESLCKNIDDPSLALEKMREKLKELKD